MNIISRNKRAYFDYEISDSREAGIVLKWHEVKSIRNKLINIHDAVAITEDHELWLRDMEIRQYPMSNPAQLQWRDPRRPRKLLMTKREIWKMTERTNKTGQIILVLELYINKRQMVKVKLGLGKKKKKIEKRSSIKSRDIWREMDREIKKMR